MSILFGKKKKTKKSFSHFIVGLNKATNKKKEKKKDAKNSVKKTKITINHLQTKLTVSF